MPKTSTLTKAHIIENITEAIGFTRIKTIETTEIMLELIKSIFVYGEDVLISGAVTRSSRSCWITLTKES
jgi:nucleoid DNA-binding protein